MPTKDNLPETNHKSKKNSRKAIKDFVDQQGRHIKNAEAKRLDSYFKRDLAAVKETYRYISPPSLTSISDCAALIGRPNILTEKKRDILCLRERSASHSRTIEKAKQVAYDRFKKGDIPKFEEIITAFHLEDRRFMSEIYKQVTIESPDRAAEFQYYEKELLKTGNLQEGFFQALPHRLDLIDIIDQEQIKQIVLQSFGIKEIIYSYNDLNLIGLQQNLLLYCLANDSERVRRLASLEVNFPAIKAADGQIFSILNTLLDYGYFGLIKIALEHGLNPDGESLDDSPLHMAAARGNSEMMALLVEYGADPFKEVLRNLGLPRGYNVFDAALKSGKVEPLKFLVENNYFSPDSETVITSLCMMRGRLTLAQLDYLIRAGLDVDYKFPFSGFNLNILHIAAIHSYNDALKAILTHPKAKHLVNEPSEEGMTPLLLAIGNYGRVKNTVFMPVDEAHEANYRYEAVKILLAAGADVFYYSPGDIQAIDIAKGRNIPEIVELLNAEMQKNSLRHAWSVLSNFIETKRWSGFMVLTIFLVYLIRICNLIFNRLTRARNQAPVAPPVDAARERAAKEAEERRIKAEQIQAEIEEIKSQRQEIERKLQEIERERQEEIKAEVKLKEKILAMKEQFSKIAQAKDRFESVETIKKRKSTLQADYDKMFSADFMRSVQDKIDNVPQGPIKSLANKLDVSIKDLEPVRKKFETCIDDYETKKNTFDRLYKSYQENMTSENLIALELAYQDLNKVVEDLKEREHQMSSQRSNAKDLKDKFNEVQEKSSSVVAETVSAKKEKNFRFDSEAWKKLSLPVPKGESSSKIKERPEKVIASAPAPAPVPAPKLERRPRKPPDLEQKPAAKPIPAAAEFNAVPPRPPFTAQIKIPPAPPVERLPQQATEVEPVTSSRVGITSGMFTPATPTESATAPRFVP